MRTLRSITVIAAVCWLTLPAGATAQQIVLQPVASGLSNPLFVGNAGDGSNRLFIVERAGSSRCCSRARRRRRCSWTSARRCSPAASRACSASRFIRSTQRNGRFFVYLHARRRRHDRDRRVRASSADPDVRRHGRNDPAHDSASDQHEPQRRHARVRAGRLSLYRRRRRRRRQRPARTTRRTSTCCSARFCASTSMRRTAARTLSPIDNPFCRRADGATRSSRIGMRNPWRFSFDRDTGQQWVGGRRPGRARRSRHADRHRRQLRLAGLRRLRAARTTIRRSAAIPPTTSSRSSTTTTSGGRCSITGGYVYRGTQGALPARHVRLRRLLLGRNLRVERRDADACCSTPRMNISSFGEDEQRRAVRRRPRRHRQQDRADGTVRVRRVATQGDVRDCRSATDDHCHRRCRMRMAGEERRRLDDHHGGRLRQRNRHRHVHACPVCRPLEEQDRHADRRRADNQRAAVAVTNHEAVGRPDGIAVRSIR